MLGFARADGLHSWEEKSNCLQLLQLPCGGQLVVVIILAVCLTQTQGRALPQSECTYENSSLRLAVSVLMNDLKLKKKESQIFHEDEAPFEPTLYMCNMENHWYCLDFWTVWKHFSRAYMFFFSLNSLTGRRQTFWPRRCILKTIKFQDSATILNKREHLKLFNFTVLDSVSLILDWTEWSDLTCTTSQLGG